METDQAQEELEGILRAHQRNADQDHTDDLRNDCSERRANHAKFEHNDEQHVQHNIDNTADD